MLLSWLSLATLWACTSPTQPKDTVEMDAQTEVDADVDKDGGTPAARVERVDLGVHATGEDGKTPEISFDLPQDVTAVVIHAEGDSSFHFIVAGLTRDQGFALVPKGWLAQTSSPKACVGPCANRLVAQRGYAAFLFPNTPLVEMRPGAHQLRIFAFDDENAPAQTKIQVSLDLVRPAPKDVILKLPINLCFTGAQGWTAKNSSEVPRLEAGLARARELFGQAGIELAPVRRFDVDKQGQYIATQAGADSDLAKLFQSGAGLPNGVNVFFTDKVIAAGAPPGANVALGVAGGIPGPPNEVGHIRGGVALSLHIPTGQSDLLGIALAHEVCHYLGLFHSSEPGANGAHDTLPDTDDDDTSNLLYWSLSEQSVKLSHEQRQVLRRSPWLVAP